MIVLYQTAVALFLLLVSFVRLPFYLPGRDLFDGSALFVLYLAYFRPLREGVAFACALGLAMDSLSAGPFGLHFVVYLFLLTVFRLAPGLFQVKNPLFLAVSAALAAAILDLALAVPAMASGAPAALLHRIPAAALLSGVLGWPVIFALRRGAEKLSAWRSARRATA